NQIISTLRAHPAVTSGVGLYVGCGNGRNYLPLVAAGLTLHGLDVSREALDQLVARRADLKPRLTCADFRELEVGLPFDYLVAIQVFQHLAGPREDVTERTAPKTGRWSQWEVVWQRL